MTDDEFIGSSRLIVAARNGERRLCRDDGPAAPIFTVWERGTIVATGGEVMCRRIFEGLPAREPKVPAARPADAAPPPKAQMSLF
jgi:hypothetical protein